MKLLKKLFGRNKLEQPLISILVPCYNSRKTLPATLKSIQQSNYKNLDVMIVDDGHEVTVEDIVSSFNDPRFRYFYKKNEGLGLTRNFGIDNAKGEFIFFLDSDDLIYPDAFSNLINYMLENNLDVVSGVTVRRDFETNVESEWCRALYRSKKISTFENRLSLFDDALSTNKLYRLSMLREKDIRFETGLYEDKVFTAKLYSLVDRIGLIDNRVYIWFIYGSQTSISTSKSVSNFKGRMAAINNLWQYIPEMRKTYQIAFYMNHDLLIYLREFEFYSEEEKNEIYNIAYEFIHRHKKYIYNRLIPNSWNRTCLDALCEGNKEKFIYTANTLSKVFQEELSKKQKV
ncbi:glycosyltransferase family 2 protein [Actinobacillus pleuropneumoniae]|uniref:Glycosyltransferase family 2 protein Cps17E n=1 Tax=Actinobacillus pleuropneumoniae serovar 17 TaxID=2138311 RepID=A0A2R4FY05_ACTPL|nr:glycosyltransferase family 2 protein [Actinobacillus pleuropneumoniae]AVT42396.1 glycosyltransferase family 2 protein Cps17E [Actinobacillus pleuropneumoniae serovar 17]AVT42410.1 glycosyltransferase family 2 protein Cps17E [Actinobacillus pleuropneumoniae serovar 17]AVT42424.1 glycosyltransferase family 2 protein Cps17E [Actinobacillus pleuropneumoniae serovar 17]AVT42437.1 glycosyltransferase family 2 protein Cps17E [Actinobacillus pleuropneumoniae serovar 17]AVT42451.1 glycosyltransferas